MGIVLALVITGWLVAFALGSQAGFDNEPTMVTQQSAVAESAQANATSYRKPMSAA